jgi:hypothetical protein
MNKNKLFKFSELDLLFSLICVVSFKRLGGENNE